MKELFSPVEFVPIQSIWSFRQKLVCSSSSSSGMSSWQAASLTFKPFSKQTSQEKLKEGDKLRELLDQRLTKAGHLFLINIPAVSKFFFPVLKC